MGVYNVYYTPTTAVQCKRVIYEGNQALQVGNWIFLYFTTGLKHSKRFLIILCPILTFIFDKTKKNIFVVFN